MEEQRARRPGGRSARVRAAVHQAVTELVAERGYGNFTVAEVAARAGVADTSIYRRWGNLEALAMEVTVDRLTTDSAMPDTGTLDGDLRAYATQAARDVNGPNGLALLRSILALIDTGEAGERTRDQFLADRVEQVQRMLDRAAARGEHAPDVLQVVDIILAPMYTRTLFGTGPLTDDYVDTLVDRLLCITER
ncbi:TetR/AcrR family transcriptional regulator [Nocardia sp. NBC_00565]|uniref:TetR/AcrR family transcriptional regulator n=1 Tax=Nocardia sp. NBC_00565 TaxID=2975993 RepID=UPI002E81E71B|nr:TetR/AcrR family transcriptional regulator [Nocardia sp. NBC_00565]WUC03000.1 TetR/AcrR family transcriptional regulator [Nocardia sp. NBC_00565]